MADLPHSRNDCPLKPFHKSQAKKAAPANLLHCDRCWCFVCEKPVPQCAQWASLDRAHCNAHPKASLFKVMRRKDSGVSEAGRKLSAAQSR